MCDEHTVEDKIYLLYMPDTARQHQTMRKKNTKPQTQSVTEFPIKLWRCPQKPALLALISTCSIGPDLAAPLRGALQFQNYICTTVECIYIITDLHNVIFQVYRLSTYRSDNRCTHFERNKL